MFKAFKAQVILIPEIEGNVIAVSKKTKKSCGGGWVPDTEYIMHTLWEIGGKRRLTSISCLSSEAFGGTCRCINHSPYRTIREEDVPDFDAVLNGIEWEECWKHLKGQRIMRWKPEWDVYWDNSLADETIGFIEAYMERA